MAGEITIQLPADISPDRLRAIMEAAGPATVVEGGADAAPEAAVGWFAAAIDRVLGAFHDLPQALAQGAGAIRAETGQSVIALTLTALAIIAAAWVIELLIRRIAPERGTAAGPAFGQRLAAGFYWLVGRVLSLAAFVLIALILGRIFLAAGPGRQILVAALTVVLFQRIIFAIVDLIFAPRDPSRRLAGAPDAAAQRVGGAFVVLLSLNALFRIGLAIVALATGGGPEDDLLSILVLCVWWLSFTIAFVYTRREIADLIRGAWGHMRLFGRPVSELARYWPALASALAFATAAAGIALILGLEQTGAFTGSFIVFALTPFVVAGISALKAERVAAAEPIRRPALEGWFALAEGGAIVLAAILLLRSWRIDPFDAAGATGAAAIAPALVSAACVVIIGVSAWRAAKAFIAAYEPAPEEDEDDGGDGLGKEGSRIGTMLPVLRGFLMALIFSITIMVALSALGVNIGPMIAGAGIFGLAIGFGSQKLVSDVISGFFYLYEDAFRVGEYVETAEGKGVVENISIRSARLRHHRGPVFTVPFSSMGTVQNHSRDWVKIKFTFQVPVNTDVEKVRKLVKKVGVQLLEDPELEGKFIEPVKSQGAVSIKGHSFEIGVKYMCKPGQQFTIRRKAYAALQTAFRENGIELHRPSITLDQTELAAAPDTP